MKPPLPSKNPPENSNDAMWTLYRVDDHGNEFEVLTTPFKAIALDAQKRFEVRKHKQAYLIRLNCTQA
jgi:hypothetical protein